MRSPIPLSERRSDWLFIGFFILNISFITYQVDLEQLVIDDPRDFEYPLWPPAPVVDLVHWWGDNFDPVLMARWIPANVLMALAGSTIGTWPPSHCSTRA